MRSIAPIIPILAGRSLAAIGVFGSARVCPDCLASLRPTERARASCRCSEAECGSEWSGRKAGKSVIGRRRNSAEVRAVIGASTAHARGSGFGATRLSPTKRMGRLCDAGFWHAHAGSLGVILLWPWPWRSLAASETKKANQNTVAVRRREERSDETSTNLPAIAADFSLMPDPRAPGVRTTSNGGLEQERSSVVRRPPRARVARGQPSVTSVNPRWLPGPPPLGGRASVRHRARGDDERKEKT